MNTPEKGLTFRIDYLADKKTQEYATYSVNLFPGTRLNIPEGEPGYADTLETWDMRCWLLVVENGKKETHRKWYLDWDQARQAYDALVSSFIRN